MKLKKAIRLQLRLLNGRKLSELKAMLPWTKTNWELMTFPKPTRRNWELDKVVNLALMSVCLLATMKGSLTLAKQSKNDQTLG